MWCIGSWLALFWCGLHVLVVLGFPMQDPPDSRAAFYGILLRDVWPYALALCLLFTNLHFVNKARKALFTNATPEK